MHNDNMNCASVCDCKEAKAPQSTLSELLRKLYDLSNENFDLARLIRDNLYGAIPEEGCSPTNPIGCMEDCIKNILTNVNLTNAVLVQIRERM